MQIDNQRLWDLLRFCRHDLHNEELITNEEFAELVMMTGAVQRLETYDEHRARARRDVAVLLEVIEELKVGHPERTATVTEIQGRWQ